MKTPPTWQQKHWPTVSNMTPGPFVNGSKIRLCRKVLTSSPHLAAARSFSSGKPLSGIWWNFPQHTTWPPWPMAACSMGNVRVRKETRKLFMDFRYQGVRCREQTALADTPGNRKKLPAFRSTPTMPLPDPLYRRHPLADSRRKPGMDRPPDGPCHHGNVVSGELPFRPERNWQAV